jgi:hypothetical protein
MARDRSGSGPLCLQGLSTVEVVDNARRANDERAPTGYQPKNLPREQTCAKLSKSQGNQEPEGSDRREHQGNLVPRGFHECGIWLVDFQTGRARCKRNAPSISAKASVIAMKTARNDIHPPSGLGWIKGARLPDRNTSYGRTATLMTPSLRFPKSS